MVGTLDACRRIKLPPPTCEDRTELVDQCQSLFEGRVVAVDGGTRAWKPTEGFAPRVAERIAECIARESQKPHGCEDPYKKVSACVRRAVAEVCIDPAMLARCDTILAACAAANAKPTYTRERCAQVLSSLIGTDRHMAEMTLGPWMKQEVERTQKQLDDELGIDAGPPDIIWLKELDELWPPCTGVRAVPWGG
jgi:hypothetical protein